MNLFKAGFEMDGSAEVVMNFLRMSFLWEKIRVQGGAYGAFCTFDDLTGVFAYLSYRDPNLAETLEHYANAADFLKNLDANKLSEQELTKNIIGVIGELDAYQLPDAKGYTSMMRYLTGRTDETLQKRRDEVLSANGEDFISFGEVLERAAQEEAVAVIGSQSAIEGANIGLKVTKVL
jgi:Zn-dependent M16 (insulinase) family peptidase